MNINQKGFVNIILVAVIVVLVGVAGYFVFVKKSELITQQPTPTPTQTNIYTSPTPTSADETADWKTYTNTQYGFSFKYPEGAKVDCQTNNERSPEDYFLGGCQILKPTSFYKPIFLYEKPSTFTSIEGYIKDNHNLSVVGTPQKVKINNLTGLKVYVIEMTDIEPSPTYYIVLDKAILTIPLVPTANSNDSLETFEAFVNTFKAI